ncbi:MAG: AIM24 family protein [Anaerolineae bacterium]|nr:AIM24 family protein [Anaerolineae bacterium]
MNFDIEMVKGVSNILFGGEGAVPGDSARAGARLAADADAERAGREAGEPDPEGN